MTQVFANNATGKLNAEVNAVATSLPLATGDGARFPTLAGGDFFHITLFEYGPTGEQNWEIVKVTARAGDTLTVQRGMENTTARVWPANTPLELRITKATLDAFLTNGENANFGTITATSATVNGNATVTGDVTVGGTVDSRDIAADGVKLDGIATGANNYTHPAHPGDDMSADTGALTGAVVISDLDFNVTTDTQGHVTDANATVATRSLTPASIGAATSGHTHSAYTRASSGLVGATVFSDVTVTNGVVTATATRNLTPANIGAATSAHGHSVATVSVDGFLSSTDKAKLDGVEAGATNFTYAHPTYAGDDMSADTGPLTGATVISDLDFNVSTDNQGHVTDANATVATRSLTPANIGAATSGHGHTVATGVADGFMSGADKAKLDGIASGATNYTYTHPTHPGDDLSIDTTLLAGATVISDLDINVTTDTQGHVTDANATVATRNLTAANIGAATSGHSHSSATTGAAGFMSATDKVKLDGVASGANNYAHPSHPGDDMSVDTGALSGATVISDLDFNVTTDAEGHVTDANAVVATRNLTAANIGAAASSHTHSAYATPTVSAGSIILADVTTRDIVPTGDQNLRFKFYVRAAGTVTVSAYAKSGSSSYDARIYIWKNGTLASSYTGTSQTYTLTTNVTVSPSSQIEVEIGRSSTGNSSLSTGSYIHIKGNTYVGASVASVIHTE